MTEYLVHSPGSEPEWDTCDHWWVVQNLKRHPSYWSKKHLKIFREFGVLDNHDRWIEGYEEIYRSEWLEEFGVEG